MWNGGGKSCGGESDGERREWWGEWPRGCVTTMEYDQHVCIKCVFVYADVCVRRCEFLYTDVCVCGCVFWYADVCMCTCVCVYVCSRLQDQYRYDARQPRCKGPRHRAPYGVALIGRLLKMLGLFCKRAL